VIAHVVHNIKALEIVQPLPHHLPPMSVRHEVEEWVLQKLFS
jgi:hypothetical protein